MTFPRDGFIKLATEDPSIWMTTERMIYEDEDNAYVELAFTDPRQEMSEYDLEVDAHMYYTHKDDCCNPLPSEDYEAKFVNMYRVSTDPYGVQRAEIRIIKNK